MFTFPTQLYLILSESPAASTTLASGSGNLYPKLTLVFFMSLSSSNLAPCACGEQVWRRSTKSSESMWLRVQQAGAAAGEHKRRVREHRHRLR